jgi:hypothetical protein
MRRICIGLMFAMLMMQSGLAAKDGGGPPPSPQAGVTKESPHRQPPLQPPPASMPRSCAQPLRRGCEAQQASCRIACPPMWSTNPGAPAFTLTDRAGCTQRCFSRYLSCLQLYGC